MTTRFLRREEVERRTGYSCSSIYRFMSEGTFPRSIKIGARACAWLEVEVDEWIDMKIAASREAVPGE